MAVLIDNQQNKLKIPLETIRMRAQAVLNALAFPDSELSIMLVEDARIAELNQEYLNRSGPTNVISFPMQEGEFGDITPFLLGDVVISTDTAEREGQAAGMGLDARFDQLLIHGILHLVGYDHENDPAEAARMAQKEAELLAVLQAL